MSFEAYQTRVRIRDRKVRINPPGGFILTFLSLILTLVNIQRDIFYLQILFNIMNRIIKKIPISAQVKKLKTK